VISDVEMPRMDGFEAMRELRRINAALPIIMMSGRFQLADQADSEGEPADRLNAASGLGATRTIGKPFRTADLLAAVCACLSPVGAAA
jgi:CheY-like chemotaxis protein